MGVSLTLLGSAAAWRGPLLQHLGRPLRVSAIPRASLSAADEQRLLMSEAALNAFVVAEMRSFCEAAVAVPKADDSTKDIAQKQDELQALQVQYCRRRTRTYLALL